MAKLTLLRAKVWNKLLHALKLRWLLRNWDDAQYLALIYTLRMGERPDFVHPKKFSEKIQWLKLNDRQPLYTTLVDKYEVKQWVSTVIGQRYVVSNIGVWDKFDDIDFSQLPEKFVLKCTHDSGGLVICDDRTKFNLASARRKITRSLKRNYFLSGREWPYKNVQPRIIAEKFLSSLPAEPSNEGLRHCQSDVITDIQPSASAGMIDYKFYCFNGEPKFLYVSQGLHDHGSARMDFMTLEWQMTKFSRPDYRRFTRLPPRPASFDEMISIARVLSRGIPFVRVDLFEHHGQVLFSEMTFHPVSGYMKLSPSSADLKLGDLLNLNSDAGNGG